jgi:hypothetical protein
MMDVNRVYKTSDISMKRYWDNNSEKTLQKLKRLKLTESDENEGENDDGDGDGEIGKEKAPLNAIIPYKSIPLSREAFRLAVLHDFPDSILASLLREKDEDKQLVLYQPPLEDLIKEASYLKEHQMDIDLLFP